VSDPIYLQLTCANCRYWHDQGKPTDLDKYRFGQCRRRSPQPTMHGGASDPTTCETHWCGDWDRQIIPGKSGLWDPHGVHVTDVRVGPHGVYHTGRFEGAP
jgi:hypothetical protein